MSRPTITPDHLSDLLEALLATTARGSEPDAEVLDALDGAEATAFGDSGVMTRDAGVVLTIGDQTFYLTITEGRRR